MSGSVSYAVVLQDALSELADEEQAKRLEGLVRRQQRRIIQEGSYSDPNDFKVQFGRYRQLSDAYEALK